MTMRFAIAVKYAREYELESSEIPLSKIGMHVENKSAQCSTVFWQPL